MALTGKQLKQVHDALLDAFDRSGLAQMVRFELNETLDVIAGGGNLSDTAFNLIQWAERQGRTQELIQGAVNVNPNNPALLAVQRELLDESTVVEGSLQPDEPPDSVTVINTGGGAYVGGNVQVGGDFVGRDKIGGQHAEGASAAPAMDKQPPGSSIIDVKRQMLTQRRDLLLAQYKAAYEQSTLTLNAADRVKLEQTVKQLEPEITDVERQLAALDVGGASGPADPASTDSATVNPVSSDPLLTNLKSDAPLR